MRVSHVTRAFVAVAVVLATGCYESLTSVVTPDKQVYYDDLPGDYQGVAPTTGRLTLEKGGPQAYAYRQFDEKGEQTLKGTLRLIRLGDAHFYEITADGFRTLEGKPIYVVGRLLIAGEPGAKTLTGLAFASREKLFDGIGIVSAQYEWKEGDEVKKGRGLSMPAQALQEYLSKHAAEMTEATLKFQQVKPSR
jgi:hypothetical protein